MVHIKKKRKRERENPCIFMASRSTLVLLISSFLDSTFFMFLKLKKKTKHSSIFIYLAAPGLSCNMYALVPWPGVEPKPSALGMWVFNGWTTKEVPLKIFFLNSGHCVLKDSRDWSTWYLCPGMGLCLSVRPSVGEWGQASRRRRRLWMSLLLEPLSTPQTSDPFSGGILWLLPGGCWQCSVTKPCPTLCDPMNCSTPMNSFTISLSLLQLMSIESVMLSNHLILCRPLLLLSSIFLSTSQLFSNELALHIRWPEYWSSNFSISPSNEIFRVDFP